MVEKEVISKLMGQSKSFVIYMDVLNRRTAVLFDFINNKKGYCVVTPGKNYYLKGADEVCKIMVSGYEFGSLLNAGVLLEEVRDKEIEKKIVRSYIKPEYQERCAYLLSNQKRSMQVALFFSAREHVFFSHKKHAVEIQEGSWLDGIKEKLKKQELDEREGYLLITDTWKCHFYKGAILDLAEYLVEYNGDEFGIVYCSANLALLQLDVETEGTRLYWLYH